MNRICKAGLAVATIVFAAVLAIPEHVEGQTVFIPTFRNFTYRGSVSVPDGGTIQLGGVNTTSESASSAGVPGLSNIPGLGRAFKNRGIGREQQAGSLTAKAEILIMDELEAQHLADAGHLPGQQAANADVLRKAAFLTEHVGRRSDSSGYSSGASSGNSGRRR